MSLPISTTSSGNRLLDSIKNILSNPIATVAIIVIVICSRIIQLVYYYNIYVDACYQVIGTQSLLDGHGISLPNVLYNDLSTTIYTPLINWPPGYSFIFAPFYSLFNNDYIAAGITIDIIGATSLIFICRSILKILNTPLYLRNLFTLLTGFFIYYFYFNQCSDAITITIFLLAIFYTLKLLRDNSHIARGTIVITSLLFICGSIKYLFMPAVFIIPAFIFLKGYSDNKKALRKAGIFSFLSLLILLSGLLIYQKIIGGSATYISASGRGFYPENLLKAYPTFPASFLKPDTLQFLFFNTPGAEKNIFGIYQLIYCTALVIICTGFAKHILKYRLRDLSLNQSFFYISFFLSMAIILLLATLSIRVEKEVIFPWRFWTYIEDGRYHGLPNVLMQLTLFASYIYCTSSKKYTKLIFVFFLLLMVPDMLRGIYFDINRIKKYPQEEYSWLYEKRFQDYADSLIINEKKYSPSNKIIITGTSYNMNNRVVLKSHVAPLTAATTLNDTINLNTKTPAILFSMIEKDSLNSYKTFLSQKGVKRIGVFDNFYFFSLTVLPH